MVVVVVVLWVTREILRMLFDAQKLLWEKNLLAQPTRTFFFGTSAGTTGK